MPYLDHNKKYFSFKLLDKSYKLLTVLPSGHRHDKSLKSANLTNQRLQELEKRYEKMSDLRYSIYTL